MEEKGIGTNKNTLYPRSNRNLYLFDDAYHKVKAQQYSIRCSSAIIRRKISFSPNIKNNLIKRKE